MIHRGGVRIIIWVCAIFYLLQHIYSPTALKTFGLFKGLLLSIKRILSCHPWNNGGFDPVKKEMKVKK